LATEELGETFNKIISKSRKENTYKFAFARFLIDYALNLDGDYIKKKLSNNEDEIIGAPVIAKFFEILLASNMQIQD
jgi:hypothetical protein